MVFISKVMKIYLPGAGTLGCAVGPGAGIACWKLKNPFQFLSTICECVGLSILPPLPLSTILRFRASLPVSTTPSLLPVWMTVASLKPGLLDFHTAQFSDCSGCYFFWDPVVILFVVAWGGKACLPMPPSWLEVLKLFICKVWRSFDCPEWLTYLMKRQWWQYLTFKQLWSLLQ